MGVGGKDQAQARGSRSGCGGASCSGKQELGEACGRGTHGVGRQWRWGKQGGQGEGVCSYVSAPALPATAVYVEGVNLRWPSTN